MKITQFKINGQAAPVSETALDGKLLPVPDADTDNGKVPVANDGEYQLQTPQSGSGPLIVTFSGSGDETSCDKSLAEVLAANKNILVFYQAVVDDPEDPYYPACYSSMGFTFTDNYLCAQATPIDSSGSPISTSYAYVTCTLDETGATCEWRSPSPTPGPI